MPTTRTLVASAAHYMKRVLSLMLLIHPLVYGQIGQFAVTDDGSQLYFSTPFRFIGSNQPDHAKIFRYSQQGFELFRQLQVQRTLGSQDTNFYLAIRPMVSGDGTIAGYTAGRGCSGGSHCLGYILYHWCVTPSNQPNTCLSFTDVFPQGAMTLSPDGTYALSFDQYSPPVNAGSLLIELTTGATRAFNSANPIGNQALANNGIALLADNTGPFLSNQGQISQLPFRALVAGISANGKIIVYTNRLGELRSYRVASGTDVLLARQGTDAIWHPWLTSDGSRVIFVLNGRLYSENTDGTAQRELAAPQEGIADDIISGSGNIVYASTTSSRLLQIDIAANRIVEISPPVPVATTNVYGGAVGAAMDFTISGASPADAVPELIGAEGVQTPPIVAASDSSIRVQVPWETPPRAILRITFPGNPGPFEWVPNTYSIDHVRPYFYTWPGSPYGAIVAHQDFGSLVTEFRPARAGEIVHLYGNGFGPVSPAIATGTPASVGALFRTQFPLACTGLYNADRLGELTIPFVGLAPTMAGIEQIDLQIPSGIPPLPPGSGLQLFHLFCTLQDLPFGVPLTTMTFPLVP